MPDEIMEKFVSQMIENLASIEASLELLLQHYQVEVEAKRVGVKCGISEATIRELLVNKTKEGKADSIRKILEQFGADRLSSLEQGNYELFYDKVKNL